MYFSAMLSTAGVEHNIVDTCQTFNRFLDTITHVVRVSYQAAEEAY